VTAPDTARFEVPMRASGAKASPSIGQRSPSARPATGAIGKSETRSSGSSASESDGWRCVKADVRAAHHDAGPRGVTHQRVVDGKLVIEPRAGEARGQHERRGDVPERLVEIGAVLLGDPMQALGRDRGLLFGTKRVEIADHRARHPAMGQRARRTAVGGHQTRRE
jgi:hypothetical protein